MTSLNMRAIQTVTVGAGGAASIQFTSIPQTYTDLIVKLSVRTTRPGIDVDDEIYLEFNGSGGTAYSVRVVEGNGTTPRSAQTLSSANMGRGIAPSDNATANTFSNCEYYIPNYAGSTNKSVSFDNTMENNATNSIMNLASGLWSNTSAITSIRFTAVGTFDQYSTATLYGVFSAGKGAKATGGIISQDANYYYHTFFASGTFTPTQSLSIDSVCVAGGGGGGKAGGGGGAGSLIYNTGMSVTATNYTVTIGAGGGGATSRGSNGTSGSATTFNGTSATGGGGGGSNSVGNGTGGGSGGGAVNNGNTGGGANAGTLNGGTGYVNVGGNGNNGLGAGGGGAGQAGQQSISPVGGLGGNGTNLFATWASATYTGRDNGYYAGGGGGYSDNIATGGLGGGGASGISTNNGSTGFANTGGGGGASRDAGAGDGGAGGSGIVIVRYAK